MSKRRLTALVLAIGLVVAATLCGLYAYAGLYGINVVLRRGGTFWLSVEPDSPKLSVAMRLALRDEVPTATAGSFEWRPVAQGFEIAELPVLAGGTEVDRILLARVDPARFRFEVRNAPAGNKGLDDWMADLGALLVINGSYYARRGTPDTPFLSAGVQLGPVDYRGAHGAFVAADAGTGIHDLAQESWETAFAGAHDAMVSYPLLLAADGSNRVNADRRWLANRSFVGQDGAGRVILGTTKDAFFSLDRFAAFLHQAPLGLTLALNLDGGGVACQGIALGDYHRHFCGKWETSTKDGDLRLLSWGFGQWALPVVLAVVPK
jgi:hypothetical protein